MLKHPHSCAELDPNILIKPGGDPNPINPMSQGVIPVAILGSDSFDVSDVDTSTLIFGPTVVLGDPCCASPIHRQLGHFEDVNDDGFTDLVSHYRTQEAGIAFGEISASVTGTTIGGIPFEGCEYIVTVPDPF